MGAHIFLDLFQDLKGVALFSGRRCSHRQRDACGDFVNLKICRLSPSEVLIGVGFAFRGAHRGRICVRVFIGVSTRACVGVYVIFPPSPNECNSGTMSCFSTS